ncbi:SRPBCC family protein [Paenibacillus thalictri]|uniref:SRPBCC family protein n=1 Tax=Paenibacillus thalictri TaxID=2527873 RepID=A0A4Q9DRZ1_9BACL|nr:SRPBCC family protein [Paenibacillus thalictri]TBL78494.1 SRPBCC family protein [Paenibacillus thalictri]
MSGIFPSKTLSVAINRKPAEVCEYVWDGNNLPEWLISFCQSVQQAGDAWILETTEGRMTFRFVEKNPFGVLDHEVTLPSGSRIMNPMRVVPNGSGCEVLFTLLQLPEMSDERFAVDAGMVERDLLSLKVRMERAEANSEG